MLKSVVLLVSHLFLHNYIFNNLNLQIRLSGLTRSVGLIALACEGRSVSKT